jgi:adenosylhomocysteine nucleosidase
MISSKDVLVVFALEKEAQGLFNNVPILTCGVGKVNATYHLTRRIAELRHANSLPKLILNVGSAGSAKFSAGKIINCTAFVQRDFDVTALGIEPFTTPYENIPAVMNYGHRYDGYDEGVCGTGDNFVTNSAMTAWNVVDMEAYALAKIAMHEKISFGCLKFITDGADGHAANTWEDALADAAKGLRQALDKVIAA